MTRRPFAPGRHFAPPRFLLFVGVLLFGGGGAAMLGVEPRTGLLGGFDVAALVFLAAEVPLLRLSTAQMRRRSEENDANRAGLLAISVLLSLVILFAVGTLIASPDPLDRADIALIVATLALAWLFANTVFTLHYAHLYYRQADGRDRGGLEVPGVGEPDYWDFLYFSFTLGMTFQTSDVTIAGAHMRRVVLGHCMAAFVFNMGILAFTVNAIGGS
ncbi:DUF1345 domain-containing protein [Sphingopyxis lindanitolerans]|uniref:DUF1345 domain-containing protein n=1 Tax=Sphingopyxis lindanitolerans TaxID=2054227 RepID=A0A2S8B907_9SPHN|nr:DUF1345 domain-containing protein [Sphingopyxis lindanitolerans]PQM28793.1 DUF1345 domain-containing protein [Sphingopyxis lindanitolerans]